MAKQSTKNFVRLDKVPVTAHYESIVSDTDAVLAGQFVKLLDVVEGSQGEEVKFEKAEAAGEFDAIAVPVYVDRGFTDFNILYESIEAGRPARALHLQKGDIISINAELAPGVAKGDNVEVGANGLGFQKATGENIVGRCIDDSNFLQEVGKLVVIRIA